MVKRLAGLERQATARLITALGELDSRRLYLGEGCSSLFTYCTPVLHLSEHAAYLRIETARAARKWPRIVELLTDGALHLTAIGLLAPHLTPDNHERVLAAARHKSKREVEEIVAALRPQPAVPSVVRKLPAPHGVASPTANSVPVPETRAHSLLAPPGIDGAPSGREIRNDAAEIRPLPGSATRASAHSWAPSDAAPNEGFSSITIGSRSRMAARQVWTTSSCDAAPITHSRRRAGLGLERRMWYARRARCSDSWGPNIQMTVTAPSA